jgi:uncharacterized protein (DUF924 family)
MEREIAEVLEFWFGELDASGIADERHTNAWFTKNPSFDDEITSRFITVHDAVASGERDAWLESPRGRLAWIIVLDQFSRNMFRGTAKMFAYDDKAYQAASDGVARGMDRELRHDERLFLYMPYMHREELAAQDRAIELFTAWRDQVQGAARARVQNALDYSELHRNIIRRFGHFPHRHAVLGRTASAEEIEFLKQPNSSF